MTQPILKPGTGRFLQAHVDLFVSQALARGDAIGGIAVVMTTNSEASHARLPRWRAGPDFASRSTGARIGKRSASPSR